MGGDRDDDSDVKGYGATIRTLGAGGRAEEECVRPSVMVVVDTWRPPERADPSSYSLTSSTKNGGMGESRGGRGMGKSGEGDERKRERARGINVARASTTNHSPSDLETLSELFLVSSGCFRGTETYPLLPTTGTAGIIPLHGPSVRPAIALAREEEEEKAGSRGQAGPVTSATVVTQRETTERNVPSSAR